VGLRNRLIFLAARLVPNFLGLATTAVLTRLLEPTEYGVYALGLSMVFFLTIGVFEWLGLSVLRMAPASKDPDLFFGTVLACFCCICGLCVIVGVLFLLIVGIERYFFLTIVCLTATFSSAWFELKQRLQLSELREGDYFLSSAARGVLSTVFVCVAAFVFRSAPIIVLSLAASNFLASLIVPERRLRLVQCRFDRTVYRTLFRFGFPLSISVGLATILMSVDKWLLQALSGPQAVGFFTAAAFVAQVPISSLAGGIGPLAYSMAVQALELRSPEAARAQLAQNFVVLLGIVVPSAVGIIALSHNLAQLMVGAAYWYPVVLLAPWLAAAAIFSSIRAYYVDTAYQLAHYNSPLIWTTVIAIVVNISLDLWLIPNLGELGAAIGSCSALFIGLVVGAVISRGVFHLPMPWSDTGKVVLSSAIMFAILHEVSMYSGALALAGQIAVGGVVYASAIIALNVHGMRDWASRRLRSRFHATGL